MKDLSQLMASLNSIQVGDMDTIRSKLVEAETACRDLELEELAGKMGEARAAFARADLKTFRKRIETVVARLGHLR